MLRDEASQDASLLPLLEFTLNELYDRRTDRGKLTFEAYQAIGGVKGALAQRAESTFTGLPAEVQRELPAIFRQLVTIGTLSDETPTGQQTPLARFAASPARMQFVQAFIAARLFVSDHADDGSAVVRITHESLLARWERLQRWLADDRELLRVKARVERAAARWLQEGRRADLLLTAGKPLAGGGATASLGVRVGARSGRDDRGIPEEGPPQSPAAASGDRGPGGADAGGLAASRSWPRSNGSGRMAPTERQGRDRTGQPSRLSNAAEIVESVGRCRLQDRQPPTGLVLYRSGRQ